VIATAALGISHWLLKVIDSHKPTVC